LDWGSDRRRLWLPAPAPLAELAAEGFGWGGNYIRGPRDAIDALAAELVGRGVEIELDDLGCLSVSRDTARRLFAERTAGEQRRAELQSRHDEELAESAAGVPRGVPALEGASALESMMAAAPPEPKRRRSVLETALSKDDALIYEPIIRDEDEQ
jgi:hypothetical protein